MSGDGDRALLGELVGVTREVEQGLPDAGLVGMDGAEVLRAFDDTRLPFFVAIGSMVLATSWMTGASGKVWR